MHTQCLIIGNGLAAYAYAYYASLKGIHVTMVSPAATLPKANSDWAQGGIIYNTPEDIPSLVEDINKASGYTSNPAAAEFLATEGTKLVKDLLIDTLNVEFDRSQTGQLKLTREGGHNLERIIYSKDTTGHAIFEKIYNFVQKLPTVQIITNSTAVELLTKAHNSADFWDKYQPSTCIGAFVLNKLTGEVYPITANKTILATGGLGQIFKHSTNQDGVIGSGYAMAHRIGARIMDLEYVQFHPTVFFKRGYPRSLITEAVRGEGGVLVNAQGQTFMDTVHPMKSLAPRDIVARAIHNELVRTGDDCVYLDISAIGHAKFKERFPAIYQKCLDSKINFDELRIPVVPAAHYTCGGVYTDLSGRTSIKNLNAIGEVACTGLHGANRLASTSLLECLTSANATFNADYNEITAPEDPIANIKPWVNATELADDTLITQDMDLIRNTMWNYVGLVRSPKRLDRAHQILSQLQQEVNAFYRKCKVTDNLLQLRNMLQTGLLVVEAARRSPVSRGCHYIQDDKI